MSELQVSGVFRRRSSFWKTPITRNSDCISGIKRNYSEITKSDGNNNDNDNNKNKKRRLLTDSEIANIAKLSGLHASNIILAVQETDGFCWFKRSSTNTNFDKDKYLEKYWNIQRKTKNNNQNKHKSNHVLRELSKEELTNRSHNDPKAINNANPNDINRSITMQRITKQRRHTMPIKHPNIQKPKKKKKKKKKKKERGKRKKKVIEYVTEQQIIRKKVKKMKRIVYKKKTRCTTVKITTEFESMNIPDFPIPDIGLNVLFCSERRAPLVAIKKFELRLMESFVMPLTSVYGQSKDNLSFITRNVLQFLMELKKDIDVLVHCIDVEVVPVRIKHSIAWYKDMDKERKSISPIVETEANVDEMKIQKEREEEEEEDTQVLDEEHEFYQHDLKILSLLCRDIEEEIAFTKYIKDEMQNEQYLSDMFDFDIANDDANVYEDNDGLCDENFVSQIAGDIDGVYSDYLDDLFEIKYGQIKYEKELKQRELRYNCLIEKEDIDVDKEVEIAKDKMDKMIFCNFSETNNVHHNHNEAVTDLRALNGYELNEDDTIDLN